MPIAKRLMFSLLLLIAGAIGYVIEKNTDKDGLAIAMVVLTVSLLVALWALAPVNRDERLVKKAGGKQ